MKKLFYLLLVCITVVVISTKVSAQRRHSGDYRMRQQSFYYYPQSNVYYSFTSRQYIYPFKNSWVVSERLPRYICIDREPRAIVTHSGFDVWNDNRYHVYQFRGMHHEQPVIVYAPDSRYNDHRRSY